MNISRRNLIRSGGAAALAVPFGDAVGRVGQTEPLRPFRFGVIADPQFAPVPSTYGVKTRFYSNSVWKLSQAIEKLNHEELEFVITLGDMIDRNWDSFQYVLPLYDDLKHDKYFLLGNHDFNVPDEYLHAVRRTVGMPSTYYEFSRWGYRFIVLDGNEISVFAPPKGDPRRERAEQYLTDLKAAGAANGLPHNGALSDTQFAWLQKTTQAAVAANQKIVIFNHYPVFPVHQLNLWDSARVIKLVTETPNVVAYFNGHNHEGNYGQISGKHFLTFRGMVETPTDTAYAIVDVLADRLEVKGFGIQESRTLRVV